MSTISREAQSIIDYVEGTGLPFRVTDVNGPGHAEHSYHYQDGTDGEGLAVDFAGVLPGVTPATAAEMAAIYYALRRVAADLAELIHNGPGITSAVKDGQLVDGAAVYGPVTWEAHRNHVHVAVERGTFLASLSHPVDTVRRDAMAATVAAAFPFQNGYVIVLNNGSVYCFGCEWKGGVAINGDQVEAVLPK